MQVVTGVMKAVLFVSLAIVVVLAVLKDGIRDPRKFVLNRNYEMMQVRHALFLCAAQCSRAVCVSETPPHPVL